MKIVFRIIIFSLLLSLFYLHGAEINKPTLKSKYQTGMVELIPIMKINNDSLPEDEAQNFFTDFAISPNGSLYLVDGEHHCVKIISDKGNFVKSIGKKGAGPGDFAYPSQIVSTGSQLLISEIYNNRFSFFSPDGSFINTIRIPHQWYIRKMNYLNKGQLLIEREVRGTENKSSYYAQLDIYTQDAQFVRCIFRVPITRFKNVHKPFEVRINLPFCADVAWDISPSGHIVYGFQEHYRIYILPTNNANTKPFSFTHPYERVKITTRDKKMVEETYIMMSRTGPKAPPKELIDQIVYPDYRPAFGHIVVDAENNILVFPFKDSAKEYYDYFDAYDLGGNFINRVKLKSNYGVPNKMFFSDSKHLWVKTIDNSDESIIIEFEVK